MDSRHKILLLDDDPELLEMYKEMLSQLPSRPEIHTATAGARAMALLEAEPFRLLICDLKMPKMDGLQVLSIVRRRFPELRTVVMTAIQDEEFRSRAYALGVDLFWLKPDTQQNMKMFLECLESLLGREGEGGFRGVQSKGLIDIKASERNGPVVGVIFLRGEEQVMLITEKGMIIRLNTAEISAIGRNTQGVRLIQLEDGDHLVSVARLAEREDDEESLAGPAPAGGGPPPS